ncbi:MAG: ATP-binding protein [Marmoricola sp.]
MAERNQNLRPSRASSLRPSWLMWLVGLVTIGVAATTSARATFRLEGVDTLPLGGAVVFLTLLLAWLWPRREHVHRMLIGTAVLTVLIYFVAGQVLDSAPLDSLRSAVAVVVQGTATLTIYRLRLGDNNLAPHRPRDLLDLVFASLLGAMLALPIGHFDGGPLPSGLTDLVWWVLLSGSYVFVGGACVMLLVQRSPRSEALDTRISVVYLQLGTTAAALAVVFAWPDLHLSWVVLLPAIWAGMSLGPWTSSAFALTASLAVVAAEALDVSRYPTGDGLASITFMHLLMGAFTFVTLLLSLLRDQRGHLAAEVVRRRQEALDQAGLLSTVFESIKDALVLFDRSGQVRIHNAAASMLLGDRLTTEPAEWLQHDLANEGFSYSIPRHGSDEDVQILRVNLAEVQYAGSRGVVAVVRDVTTEHERLEELSTFAAVAAHDLKSPLAAVQGWIEVAEDAMGADGAMVLEALGHSRSATTRMSREIDDWLTYSVAREGAVDPQRIDLHQAIETIAATYPTADISVQTPDVVLADPTLFQHLMVNLLGNAVKYTAPGDRPSVAVRSFAAGTSGWVRIYVVDNGIGIPEGEELAIFEPFRRASSVSGYEGSGLGLALCKRIVRRHGGQITARRNSDRGTTISLTLPVAPVERSRPRSD